MVHTLHELVKQHDNDYSHLEEQYRYRTESELVTDPYTSVHRPLADLHMTASVIIPAYNASHTLLQCLYAIEQSSFNRAYTEQLEVIVVDDGSTDGTWELLNQLSFGFSLKIVRQANAGRSQARNTALSVARGDIIICCDADIVMAPFTIEEFMKRHQILDHILLPGFYTYLPTTHPQAHPALLPRNYGREVAPFQGDRRVQERAGLWPASIFRETNHLKNLSRGKLLYAADDAQIGLPQTLFGPLFSLSRRDFLLMGGFEERIEGWGGEIVLVAARAIALGNYIIPVYSAAGFHIYQHPDEVHSSWRNRPEQRQTWQEYARNFQLYQHLLHAPFTAGEISWVDAARARIQRLQDCPPLPSRIPSRDHTFSEAYHQVLAQPDSRVQYFMSLGLYEEALVALQTVPLPIDEQEARRMVSARAAALLCLGRPIEAISTLQEARGVYQPDEGMEMTFALVLAANHQFEAASQKLQEAQKLNPGHPGLRSLSGHSFEQHRARAALFAEQQDYELALRDYEAALIHNPTHFIAQAERVRVLQALHREEESKNARDAYYLFSHPLITAFPERLSACHEAWIALIADQVGAAKGAMERLHRLCGSALPIAEHLRELREYAQGRHWQYSHQLLLASVRDIPGPFTHNELELLLSVVMQVLITQRTLRPMTFVELGSFCGQATIVLGRAIQSTHACARILALSEVPDEIIKNDYFFSVLPQEMLEWQLHKHAITKHVIQTIPGEGYESELLLVSHLKIDGQMRQKVERVLGGLRPLGMLLLHQYTNEHPAIQDMIQELLMSGSYHFLAQVDGLIALQRMGEQNKPGFGGPPAPLLKTAD